MDNNIIYTPNFIKWFGDWENGVNCSKVVDNNGYPLIVYHGTENEFNEFSSKFMGQTGTAGGQGFYFASTEDDARMYGNNVKGFYLNIRKPLSSDRLTINKKQLALLIDKIDKYQSSLEDGFNYGILSDYGDVDYEGRNNVLRNAVELEMSGSDNDVELIGGVINASGDYDLVTKILRETLGYDGIILKEKGIYIVHHPNQIKEITNQNYNPDSNNFYESIKKIRITENQLKYLIEK